MSAARPASLAGLLAVTATLLAAPAAVPAADWELHPLPPPPGGLVSTPVGTPGGLSFWAPNRGVMTVSGNTSIPSGLFSWDGQAWHQLATVCGAVGRAPVVWAGPTEFWTLTAASPGVKGEGALCRFKDGAVAGSYSNPNVSGYGRVFAGACRSAVDCWFGGGGRISADGAQAGGFHLRWNGSELRPVYSPQGRLVTDLQVHGGRLLESVSIASAYGSAPPPVVLREPEAAPALLHWLDGDVFSNDPWLPAQIADLPADGSDLAALDSDGATAWGVGGPARTGPAQERSVPRRPPLIVRYADGRWQELEVPAASGLGVGDYLGDVVAVPGTRSAWATIAGTAAEQPRVAFIAEDGTVRVQALAALGEPTRGAAAMIDCPAADDCWLATERGYLYRWGGPKQYAVDRDPAFQGTITDRPNEGAAQFVADTPPDDDSRLFAPPVELPVEDTSPPATCRRPASLMSGVRPPERVRVGGQPRTARNPRYRLIVRFRLARRARVSLIAERTVAANGGSGTRGRSRRRVRVVARTPVRPLAAGRRSLTVTVRRTTWPSRLRFFLREAGRIRCIASTASRSTAASR